MAKLRKTSLDVAEDLWRKVKIRAAQEGRTVREILHEAIGDYLKKGVRRERTR